MKSASIAAITTSAMNETIIGPTGSWVFVVLICSGAHPSAAFQVDPRTMYQMAPKIHAAAAAHSTAT